ncbi:MAG: hemolysin family channel protein [Bacillales bacterium]|jgi:hemolysin III|nr:hemolysin family channel protein [Bacillales bacterium]
MNWLKMREPVNTWTHFITCIAAVVGFVFLLIEASESVSQLVTISVFGVSVILLYGASSLYHWVRTTPEKELIFKKIDHIAIYLLIGGTYTPVLFFGLDGAWRLTMMIVVWSLVAIGIFLKIWFIKMPRMISTIFYISLGWMAVIPFGQLVDAFPVHYIILLVSGGVAYTVGGIIYATKIFNFFPNKFGFHEIFHIFVMLGTTLHFLMILFLIKDLPILN